MNVARASYSSTMGRPPVDLLGEPWVGEEGGDLASRYYRARYYDPKAGRFLSEDPMGFAGGDVNLYAYVFGSPTNWVDPFGLAADLNLFTPADRYTDANGNVFDPQKAGDKFTSPTGAYTVVGHGFVYKAGDLDAWAVGSHDLTTLTPKQLADRIFRDPNWNGRPIDILACDTDGTFAESVADELASMYANGEMDFEVFVTGHDSTLINDTRAPYITGFLPRTHFKGKHR